MADTKIEWTDKVWNPVTGCTKVSEGCRNCYAGRLADRFFAKQYPPNANGSPRKFTDVRCHEDRLEIPLHWRKPQRVFVNSMSDLFHQGVPDEFIDRAFAVMALCPQHTFQILTKRAARIVEYFEEKIFGSRERVAALLLEWKAPGGRWWPFGGIRALRQSDVNRAAMAALNKPLPNVWLGVSVENQATADERISLLLQTPAAIRWVSFEPMLGLIDLKPRPQRDMCLLEHPHDGQCLRRGLDWVVCGGESGPGARPVDPDWVRSLRDQCQGASVAFFFKQWGGKKAAGRLLDGREWNEFPKVGRC
jgi:protein gp37